MVNIFEEFKKVEKRLPTQSELAELMLMQREQEGWKKQHHKQNLEREAEARAEGRDTYISNGTVYKVAKPPVDRHKRDRKGRILQKGEYPQKMPLRSRQIDRALKVGVSVSQIAFMLDVKEPFIRSEIAKWEMPRK